MTRRGCSLLLAVVAVALGGCGLGAGRQIEGPKTVDVQVTQDFGAKRVDSASVKSFRKGETVMQLLQSEFEVETAYGGGFVQSIEGLPGGGDQGDVDWFYFVNGIEASTGAAERKVTAGDRIWWDRRDWSGAQRIPAVVGSFPEPFIHGTATKRAPLTLQCNAEERDCGLVEQRLKDAGVVGTARTTGVGTGTGRTLVRVLIGPWSAIRDDPAARLLEGGPQKSGVFAKPAADGKSIELLDSRGEVRQTLGSGGGIIAATRYDDQQPTWVVTGVDEAGVAAAANAFDRDDLRDRFAVAVADGEPFGLPVRDEPGD